MVIFEAKIGAFGEYGWKDIGFWKWFKLKMHGGYITRIRRKR